MRKSSWSSARAKAYLLAMADRLDAAAQEYHWHNYSRGERIREGAAFSGPSHSRAQFTRFLRGVGWGETFCELLATESQG